MRTNRSRLPMLVLGLLGVSAAGLACSSSGTAEPGTGGATATGGTTSTGGQTATGGASSGGSSSTGGVSGTGGVVSSGGSSTGGAGGSGGSASGGAVGSGGDATGGKASGGTSTGGSTGGTSAGGAGGKPGTTTGGTSGGAGKGGSAAGGSTSGGSGGSQGGTCTASVATGKTVTGTGPHKVVIETNADNGIKCGTIYRPMDLGGTEKYPIFVWGEGGCSQDGYSNQAAMGEIASWGYFIIADGTPGSTNACASNQNGKPFLDYITWAIAENGKSCSAYHQSLETTKIAADGFSCGGLMSENVSGDPRFSAIGFSSSGLMAANAALYDKIHTPFKIMNGGSSDIAYDNGLRDYNEISTRPFPIIYFSKTSAGHGGDLGQAKGDFNSVNLAWLNWQLKGDTGATGKAFLIGPTCKFCMNSGWVFKSANVQ